MNKRLFTHGGVYSVSRAVTQGLGFLLLPVFAHVLGDEGYGVVNLLIAVATFVGFIFLQGMHGAWFRLRFDFTDANELRAFETTVVWYLLFSAVVGLGLLSVIGPPLARWLLPGVPFYPLVMITAVAAAANMFANLYERQLQARQQPVRFAIFSAFRVVLMLGAILLFVVGLRRGVRGKVEADALAALLVAAAALIMIRPGSPHLFSMATLRRCLAYGLPLVPHNLAGLINNLIDRLVLNALLGKAVVGIYAAGWQIASVGLVVATALNQAFAPIFIRSMKEAHNARGCGEHDRADRTLHALAHSMLLMTTAIACLAIGVTAVGREILALLTPASFADSWRVVAPCAAGALAWAAYFPFAQPLFYEPRHTVVVPIITICAATVNIGANFLFIPRWGMMGAALATLLSNAVMAGLALRLGRRAVDIPYRWRRWLLVAGSTFLTLALLWTLDACLANPAARLIGKLACASLAMAVNLRAVNVTTRQLVGLITPLRGPS